MEQGLDAAHDIALDGLIDLLPAGIELFRELVSQQLCCAGELRPGVLDGLADGLCTVSGDGGHGLDRALYTVDDLGAGGGDGLLLLGGAVLQGLGHALGDRLDAVHEGSCSVGDRSHNLCCGVLRQLLVGGQTLCKTLADIHADLVKDLGGRVDAEEVLDGARQKIDKVFYFADQRSPARRDAVPQAVYDEFADIQPAERCEYVKDCLADLRDVGDQGRDRLYQPLEKGSYQLHACNQKLRGVVVDDACDVRNNAGQLLDQGRQAVRETLRQIQDERDACVHDLTDVLPQPGGKVSRQRQRLRQKCGNCAFYSLAQHGDHLDAGAHKLGQGGAQPLN